MPRDYTHEVIALGTYEGSTVPMQAQEAGQITVNVDPGTIGYHYLTGGWLWSDPIQVTADNFRTVIAWS